MTARIIVNTIRTSATETRNYMWADVVESGVIKDEFDKVIGLIWDAPDYVRANSQAGRLCSGLIGARTAFTDEDEAEAVKDIRIMAQWQKNKGQYKVL